MGGRRCLAAWFLFVLGMDVVVVYEYYGLEWAFVSAICFPITIFVAPVLAIMNDSENIVPMVFSVILAIWLIIGAANYMSYRARQAVLEAQTAAVARHLQPTFVPVSDHERYRFVALLAKTNDVIAIIEAASYARDMERFQRLMRHIDNELYDLGVPMPHNAEGETALYMRLTQLKKLMEDGMLELARMPLE